MSVYAASFAWSMWSLVAAMAAAGAYTFLPQRLLREVDLPEFPARQTRPALNLLVFAAAIALAALCYLSFGASLTSAAVVLFAAALVALAAIDLEIQLLPDAITLPLLWIGLIVNTSHLIVSPDAAIFGAILGYAALWLPYQLHRLLTGRDGMGHGDFKLGAAIGAWTGWMSIPSVLLLAIVSIATITAIRIALKNAKAREPHPFGPYLASSALIVLFHTVNPGGA